MWSPCAKSWSAEFHLVFLTCEFGEVQKLKVNTQPTRAFPMSPGCSCSLHNWHTLTLNSSGFRGDNKPVLSVFHVDIQEKYCLFIPAVWPKGL